MKKHWLSAMLAMSVALLLAGGVALAQQPVEVDQRCFECWPGSSRPTDDEYIVEFDLPVTHEFYFSATNNEAFWTEGYPDTGAGDLPILWVGCDGRSGELFPPYPDFQPAEYGNLVFRFWWFGEPPDPHDAEVSVLFAEVCEAEFVPEPGTILLLGSGLAGLAGYATLRLRSGQAHRSRTRE